MEKLSEKKKMKIKEIRIKNFRGYGENPEQEDGFYEFKDLDQPDVILLTGHNGYGKSSFYEAVEWCITDDIKALKKITEEANQKTTLRKSRYLKFQSLYDDREREAVVKILFDNGTCLIRSTKYDSLHNLEYRSEVRDGSGKSISNDEVREFITDESGQPPDSFFRLCFYGQAFSKDLVRGTSAKERNEILLGFLGMNIINDLINKSNAKKNQLLNKKLFSAENDISSGKKAEKELNHLFQINQWGSIQDYQNTVRTKFEQAADLSETLKELGFEYNFELENHTISHIVELLNKSRILMERMEQEYEQDQRERSRYVKESLLMKYKKNQVFLQNAEIVDKIDFVELQKELIKYRIKVDNYRVNIENLRKEKIEINSSTIQSEKKEKEVFLSEPMIQKYETEKENYEKIVLKSQRYGIQIGIDYQSADIRRLLKNSMIFQKWLMAVHTSLKEKQDALKTVSELCKSQKEMLLKVQEFINEQDSIKRCPVCKGIGFFIEGENAKDKLLSIISESITNGNQTVKLYNDEILKVQEMIKRLKRSYLENVWRRFVLCQESLQEKTNESIQLITEKLDEIINCNEKMLMRSTQRYNNVQKKTNDYEEFKKKYDLEKKSLDEIIKSEEKAGQWMKSVLAEKYQVNKSMEFPEIKKNKSFIKLVRKINREKRVIDEVTDILKYDIGAENVELLKKYEKISDISVISELEGKRRLYQDAINFRSVVNRSAKSIQSDMINNYITNNDMIKIIYKMINPHPFFRDFQIKKDGAETNIELQQKENIFLDHLFSEAQIQVLSLSVFLGLNLSVKNSSFEQIYIDDPVQSMDDINMVSFIDLLRSIKKSKKVNRNLIIGTHDFTFSKLVKIKFRNHSFVEYLFESYSKEGPVIKRRDGGLA